MKRLGVRLSVIGLVLLVGLFLAPGQPKNIQAGGGPYPYPTPPPIVIPPITEECLIKQVPKGPAPTIIKQYFYVKLDPKCISEKVKKGGTVELPFAPKVGNLKILRVLLKPNDMRAPGFRAFIESEQIPSPPVSTFSGKVVLSTFTVQVGFLTIFYADLDPNSEVRVTITRNFVSGYIFYQGEWSFIEPLKRFSIPAPVNTHLVYNGANTEFSIDLSWDTLEGAKAGAVADFLKESRQQGALPPQAADSIIASPGLFERTTTLIGVGDREFQAMYDRLAPGESEL